MWPASKCLCINECQHCIDLGKVLMAAGLCMSLQFRLCSTVSLGIVSACVSAQQQMCVCCREPMRWIHADASNKRLDEKYLITQRVQMPLAHLAHLLSQVCHDYST